MKETVASDENQIVVTLTDFNYTFTVEHHINVNNLEEPYNIDSQRVVLNVHVSCCNTYITGKMNADIHNLTKLYEDMRELTANNKKFRITLGYKPRVIYLLGMNTVLEAYGHLNFVKAIDTTNREGKSLTTLFMFKVVTDTYSINHNPNALRKHFLDIAIKDLN